MLDVRPSVQTGKGPAGSIHTTTITLGQVKNDNPALQATVRSTNFSTTSLYTLGLFLGPTDLAKTVTQRQHQVRMVPTSEPHDLGYRDHRPVLLVPHPDLTTRSELHGQVIDSKDSLSLTR